MPSFIDECISSLLINMNRIGDTPSPTSLSYKQNSIQTLINGISQSPSDIELTTGTVWRYDFYDPINDNEDNTNEIMGAVVRITQNNDNDSPDENLNIKIIIGDSNSYEDDPFSFDSYIKVKSLP